MTPTPEEIERLAAFADDLAKTLWSDDDDDGPTLQSIAAALRLLADTMRERDEARRLLAEADAVIADDEALAKDGVGFLSRRDYPTLRQQALERHAARLAAQKEG